MLRETLPLVIPLVLCEHWVFASGGFFRTSFHAHRPTFVFLNGQTKVDQVRGANKGYVLRLPSVTTPHSCDQSVQ